MDLKHVRTLTIDSFRQDWRTQLVKECEEPLVAVAPEACVPWYHHMGLANSSVVYLRQTVNDMLKIARYVAREAGYDVLVYDGWRSVELQEELFWHYMRLFTIPGQGYSATFKDCMTSAQVREQFNTLTTDTRLFLREANRQYVSVASTDPRQPSPHATGGAVDVWLHHADGQPADLGVPFDWMETNAGAFYHLEEGYKPWPDSNTTAVIRHREILLRAMLTAGFSCYPPEIWHFNYGNQMDSAVRGGSARYGYVTP